MGIIFEDKPQLQTEWYYEKNILDPTKLTSGSTRKVWWKCEHNHEWESTIHNRTKRGDGCPYCSGRRTTEDNNFGACFPELAKQWHPTKNGNLSPSTITRRSGKQIWWTCEKEHEWRATPSNRSKGQGCPYCKNKIINNENSLAFTNKELLVEWDYEKNKLDPNKIPAGTPKKVFWKCALGHSWEAKIYHRAKSNSGCPTCFKLFHVGEKHQGWKGGISKLASYLRRELDEWKTQSLKSCNYRCVLTKETKNIKIHHLFSFNAIVEQIFQELGMPIHQEIGQYTDSELVLIKTKLIEKHNNHPLGVCLIEKLHKLFHFLYGLRNNTPQQFEEFKMRYFNGEFNDTDELVM